MVAGALGRWGRWGSAGERNLILAQDVAPSPLRGADGWKRTEHGAAAESYDLVSCFTSAVCCCMNFPLLVTRLHVGLLSSSVWAVV